MDLLVSFASTALVAGLWLCHNQVLRISLMVLGGIGLVVFVVLTVVLYKKKGLGDEGSALGFLVFIIIVLCAMLLIFGYVQANILCIIIGLLTLLIPLSIGSFKLFDTREEVI
ncbi:hypothetical protein ADUPG1_011527 [Aduncisulcus paluster]|nr:hypothetical protein ADUPG1_011527 [Aduncisulcus paluster]